MAQTDIGTDAKIRQGELAVTKLAPQVRGENRILRQVLLDRLDDIQSCRLTVVHAGAGYGKTSLLMQWLDELKQRQIRTMWLTLEEEEATASTFLRHIVAALSSRSYVDDRAPSLIGTFDDRLPAKSMAAAFVNLLARTSEPLVLFLDEYNRAQSADTDELLRLIIRNVPSHAHFVIASRHRPEIDIENLRAHSDLVEITSDHLRFSEDEVAALFKQSGTIPDDRELVRLKDRTEGWPIALQMARMWLDGDGKRANLVSDFSGRTSELARYLTEQVLSDLPGELQDFVMQTAILERINGDIANAVTRRTDAWLVLDQLLEKSLFLVPESDDSHWFRYHTLFRDFLRDRLGRYQPDRVKSYHRRAALWFAEHSSVSAAIDHALEAGDTNLAGDVLLDAGGWRLIMDGRIGVVRKAISGIPAVEIDERIGLALAKMFLIVKNGDVKGARSYFSSLESSNDRPWSAREVTDWKICEHILSDYADDPVRFSDIERLRVLRGEIAADDHIAHAILLDSLANAYYRYGLLDESLAACHEAIVHYRALGSLYGEVFSRLSQARVYTAQARLDDAENLLNDTKNELEDRFGSGVDLPEHTAIYRAHVMSLRGMTAEAASQLADALPVAENSDGWYELYEAAYSAAAVVAWNTGGIGAVLELSERVAATAKARGLDRLAVVSDWLSAYYLCLADRHNESMSYVGDLQEFFGREDKLHLSSLGATVGAVLALVWASQGRIDEADELLMPAISMAKNQGAVLQSVQFDLVLADVRMRSDRMEEAAALLGGAVHDNQFTGLRQPFMELGPRLSGLIDSILDDRAGLSIDHYRDKFLRNLRRDMRRRDLQIRKSGIQLTPGEVEVLKELDHGLSNKEIARRLEISPNTVKYRMKGLFAKLGVSKRTDAVKRSRRLALLPSDQALSNDPPSP